MQMNHLRKGAPFRVSMHSCYGILCPDQYLTLILIFLFWSIGSLLPEGFWRQRGTKSIVNELPQHLCYSILQLSHFAIARKH